MKKYFTTVELANGQYVNIVFESENKLKTWDHQSDFRKAISAAGIELKDKEYFTIDKYHSYRCRRISRFMDNCYLMNKKNMYEMCFEDYETIDLTK